MRTVDWLIVAAPLAIVVWIAIVTRRHVRDVAGFLAAGRAAGRYLVCNAEGAAAFGAVTIIAIFEMFYRAGFAIGWWNMLAQPIWLIITLSGYMIYRFRETRVLTLPQFFELRYSRRFRVFMGMLGWLSGIAVFGIVPAVGARFFVYFCGWPHTIILPGGLEVPTFALVMAVLLSINLWFATMGGQLTALVTDCVEGLISGVMFLVIAFVTLQLFDWDTIVQAMSVRPAGESMFHPFHTSETRDFNIAYILIGIVGGVYGYTTSQGSGCSFIASAISPHEAKMGRILGQWRGGARSVMIVLLAIGAYAYMNHPNFAPQAAEVKANLNAIDNPQIQEQMTVPVAMSHFLPAGIKGMFVAIVLFAIMAADTAAMHGLGSVFVQDIYLPLRHGKQLSPERHLRLLRLAIVGVAIFAFIFSLLFRQTDLLFMYMAVTGSIYVGGAGAVMIGGMYWSKGTTAAAWTAMLVGAAMSIGGIVWQQLDVASAPNGQWVFCFAMIAASGSYVTVSLLTSRGRDFNMDQMLRRGRYALDEAGNPLPAVERPPRSWRSLIGIDSQFTAGDKFLSIFLFTYTNIYFGIFVVLTIWNLIDEWPERWWASYWFGMSIAWGLILTSVTTVWFTWGGLRDLRALFRRLREESDVDAESPAEDELVLVASVAESAEPDSPADR